MADATPSGAPNTLPPLDEKGFPYDTTWVSILQFFVKEPDQAQFEQDLDAMYELGKKQPGYIWAHYGRSMIDGRYFVISEWESYEQMKAWEHEPTHEALGDAWEPRYEAGRDMENRKLIPWYRPDKPRKAWTK
jgi:heme-degrading monooxygenase HmoA